MKSKVRRDLNVLRKTLSNESWATYRKLIGRLCQEHCEADWSGAISGFIRNGDVKQLVLAADSLVLQKYDTAARHFAANQIAALVRKYPFPADLNPYDPEKQGLETFHESEQRCLDSNKRFRDPKIWGSGAFGTEINRMHSFIRYVIGQSPVLKVIYDGCYFGPGASMGVHGNATNVARKIASRWSVSPSAYMYARSAVLQNWHLKELLARSNAGSVFCLDENLMYSRFEKRVSICAHNKIAFVPKTVKTFRSIAVEPTLNGYLQGGVDAFMRGTLRRIGIDLSLGQSINSEMARKGSLRDDGDSYVTIDLKSASDSISIKLVEVLLPPDWFDFLNSIRSKSYLLNGVVKTSEKFCSSGNGFCFPLETLIFTAACDVTGCGKAGVDFHVYGDDIIVRKKHAEVLILLLEDLGFEVNTLKTFIQGPFRESCGTDWFGGVDVRPFTLDFRLDSFQSLAKLLNLSRRNSSSQMFFEGIRGLLLDLLPDNLRIFRPLEGPPDTAITVERDLFMSCPHSWWSRDLQTWGWIELIHSSVPDTWKELRDSDISLVMAALQGASSEKPFTVRRKTRTSIRKVAYA